MQSTAILTVVFASLMWHAHSDLIMKTQTYDFNATATDNKGKTIPVKGTLVNLQVVYISANESQRNDDVTFNISANVPNGESADMNDYFESVPTATFNAPPSQENSGKNTRAHHMDRPKVAPPAFVPPQHPQPPTNPQVIPPILPNGLPGSPQPGPGKQLPHPEPFPHPLNNLPPQPLPIQTPRNSLPSKSTAQASGSSPPLNTTANSDHKPPPSHGNSTTHNAGDKQGNPRAKRSVGSMKQATSAKPEDRLPKTYRVQNMTILPGNLTASVNLSPIAGYPWIKNATGGDNSTQVYENAHYLNLRAPITNVAAFGSPFSLSDNGEDDLALSKDSAGGEKHYDDLQSLLLSARQNATNNLRDTVEGFFNGSNAQSNVIEIATEALDELIDMDDGTEDRMEYGDSSSGETSEVHGTQLPPQAANTTGRINKELGGQTTNGGQVTNGTSGNATTGNPSPTGSGNATTENPSTAGSGNVLVSSWMVIFTSLIAVVLTIVV